jgi:chromosome segregation ATPase
MAYAAVGGVRHRTLSSSVKDDIIALIADPTAKDNEPKFATAREGQLAAQVEGLKDELQQAHHAQYEAEGIATTLAEEVQRLQIVTTQLQTLEREASRRNEQLEYQMQEATGMIRDRDLKINGATKSMNDSSTMAEKLESQLLKQQKSTSETESALRQKVAALDADLAAEKLKSARMEGKAERVCFLCSRSA